MYITLPWGAWVGVSDRIVDILSQPGVFIDCIPTLSKSLSSIDGGSLVDQFTVLRHSTDWDDGNLQTMRVA